MKPGRRSWSNRVFGCGGVIAYHGVGTEPHLPAMHITPRCFREQVRFLAENYNVIPLRELMDRWRVGASTNGSVAITFDDAYAGVVTHALPVLQEWDLPATIFVASGHADLGAAYWWDEAERERLAIGHGSWSHCPASVGLAPLDAANPASMDVLRTQVLARFSGRWPSGIRPATDEEWRSLRFDEMRPLAADDRIDFGVHTLTHPSLPSLTLDEQVREMRENFELLERRLPRVVPIIAYPYGLYDRVTVRAAAAAGMVGGVTMEGRAPSARPHLLTVPRVGAGEAHSIQSISRRLNRAFRAVLVVRNRSIHPRVPRPG